MVGSSLSHHPLSVIVNGLPFRGDKENSNFSSESFGGGVYHNTFMDLIFRIQPELKKIAEKVPANVKYTAPKIQNEVIEVLQKLLKSKINKSVKEAEYFTTLADGSSDKSLREIEATFVRYINADHSVAGHAIDMIDAKADRSAKRLLIIMDTSLKDSYLNCGSIASQCYDGTSVMSGKKGGLQILLSDKCGRSILS